jgi:hypothetical protein
MKSSLDPNLGAKLSREIENWGGTSSYDKKGNKPERRKSANPRTPSATAQRFSSTCDYIDQRIEIPDFIFNGRFL